MNSVPYHDYQIPKRKSPAEIELASVPRRKIHLFLSQIGSDPGHLEAPSQLLNQATSFLPVVEEDDTCSFVYVPNILVLTVPLELEAGGPFAAELHEDSAMSANVTIRIEGGTTIGGKVLYIMPEGQQRVSDFLNRGTDFIPVRDGESVHLINRYKIVQVKEQH